MGTCKLLYMKKEKSLEDNLIRKNCAVASVAIQLRKRFEERGRVELENETLGYRFVFHV